MLFSVLSVRAKLRSLSIVCKTGSVVNLSLPARHRLPGLPRPSLFRLVSSQTTIGSRLFSPVRRVVHFFRNDPFAKVSVIFGGVVLSVLLIIEAFTKTAKKRKVQVVILPPQCNHYAISREALMATLDSCVPGIVSTRPSVVSIIGPSGSGKTELAMQFAQQFATKRSPLSSAKPLVVSLDGSNAINLGYSLRYAAYTLGIPSANFYPPSKSDGHGVNEKDQIKHFMNSLFAKLSSYKGSWLLLVDNLKADTSFVVDEVLSSVVTNSSLRRGCVLVTSQSSESLLPSVQQQTAISLSRGLTEEESNSLFLSLNNLSSDQVNVKSKELYSKLSCDLQHQPMAVSLAALTTKIYAYFLTSSDPSLPNGGLEQALSSYLEVLASKCSELHSQRDKFNAVTDLYIEALCAADPCFWHALDFLFTSDPRFPVPLSSVSQHLKNPFYSISSQQFYSPLEDPVPLASDPAPPLSYIDIIKSKIPFIGQSSSPLPPAGGGQNQALQRLAEAQGLTQASTDLLTSLKKSPFVRIHDRAGLDLVYVNPTVRESMQNHFLEYTAPKLEEAKVKTAKEQFMKEAWFKQFRSFNEDSVLSKYLKSLPGLSEGGVLTEEQFNRSRGQSSFHGSLTYSQYLHLISHYHRFSSTLNTELKYLTRDAEDLLLRRHIQPHLDILSQSSLLPNKDRVRCQVGLLSIDAAFTPTREGLRDSFVTILQSVQEQTGSKSTDVANTLTKMADIKYYRGDYEEAVDLLNSALHIHKQIPHKRRSPEDSLDYAVTLSTLGLVYAAQGQKQESRDYLEKSLGLYQVIPTNGEVTKKQRKIVATTVTDLGHAYVSLGDVVSAKRYLELALNAHRSLHAGSHHEVARTLNVMSIVYSMIGDSPESKRLRKESQMESASSPDVL